MCELFIIYGHPDCAPWSVVLSYVTFQASVKLRLQALHEEHDLYQ